jgi:hypothetical protein
MLVPYKPKKVWDTGTVGQDRHGYRESEKRCYENVLICEYVKIRLVCFHPYLAHCGLRC